MKKILLLVVGISVLVLGAEKVYAYIQDCPRREVGQNINIGGSNNTNGNYGNAYHHEEYHNNDCQNCNSVNNNQHSDDCNCPNCNRVNNSEYQYHQNGHHNGGGYGHRNHAYHH